VDRHVLVGLAFFQKGSGWESWLANLVYCVWELTGFKADGPVGGVVSITLRYPVACVHDQSRLGTHDLHRPPFALQFSYYV